MRRDYSGAEEVYRKTLQVDAGNVDVLCKYAALLTTAKKDYERAVSVCLCVVCLHIYVFVGG